MVLVMATGVFDILHVGHIHFLKEARKLGDELVVVIASDATVRKRKHNPIMPQDMRAEIVGSLKMVDRVFIGGVDDPYRIVEEIKPDVIALGYDQEHDEAVIEQELARRGLSVRVVRLGRYDGDLNGTRKIIRRVLAHWEDLYRADKDPKNCMDVVMEDDGR